MTLMEQCDLAAVKNVFSKGSAMIILSMVFDAK
jgi:hypothetical protein